MKLTALLKRLACPTDDLAERTGPEAQMKHVSVSYTTGFHVLIGDDHSQAATMVIEAGGKEGGADNRHHGTARKSSRDPQYRSLSSEDAELLCSAGLQIGRQRIAARKILVTESDADLSSSSQAHHGTKSEHLAFVDELNARLTMPSKSAQQHRFMEAAAHNPSFAEKAGIPQKVAKEFVAADERATKKKAAKKKPAKKRTSTRKRTKIRA
jgi:hypothetical protein